MVIRGRTHEPALHQQSRPDLHRSGRALRHCRQQLHHAGGLSRLRPRRVPRPVPAQQLTGRFRARRRADACSGQGGQYPGRQQRAVPQYLSRHIHQRVDAGGDRPRSRLRARCRRGRPQWRRLAGHLRVQRRRSQRCAVHQQRRRHVHRQGRAFAEAHQHGRHGHRYRRLQQRWLARHHAGGHAAVRPGAAQAHERICQLR